MGGAGAEHRSVPSGSVLGKWGAVEQLAVAATPTSYATICPDCTHGPHNCVPCCSSAETPKDAVVEVHASAVVA